MIAAVPRARVLMLAAACVVVASACDTQKPGAATLYVADESSGEASVHILRATAGHDLRAEAFNVAYLAQGDRPLCGCVEVDAGQLSGAPPGLLEDAAHLGDERVQPGSEAMVRICAKDFEAANAAGESRGLGTFELGERLLPVDIWVSLHAGEADGHKVDVRLELPLKELGFAPALLAQEMIEPNASLEFHGNSRVSRDSDPIFARKYCAVST